MDFKRSAEQVSLENIDVTGRYETWDKYIQTCKARDFFTPIKNVVKVNYTDSIKTVLSALFAFKLKGFPVYDVDTDKYRAFVDVLDIVEYVLNVIEKATKQKNIDLPTDSNQIVLSHEISELDIPISEAMNYSQENFLFMLPETTLLREILYVMGPGSKHRVWIYNNNNNTGSGLITHAKLLQLFREDLRHFPDIANKTVASLNLGSDKVLSIGYEETVADGFKMLTGNNVQGIAILNSEGRLESEITSNDVKHLSLFGEFFENLSLPIKKYYEILNQYCKKDRNPGTCQKSDTLLHVVQVLTSRRASHLFIVEDDAEDEKEREREMEENPFQRVEKKLPKPIGVISAGDVLRALWQFCDA